MHHEREQSTVEPSILTDCAFETIDCIFSFTMISYKMFQSMAVWMKSNCLNWLVFACVTLMVFLLTPAKKLFKSRGLRSLAYDPGLAIIRLLTRDWLVSVLIYLLLLKNHVKTTRFFKSFF